MMCCCVEFSAALIFATKRLFPNMLHPWRPALLTLEYNLNTKESYKNIKCDSQGHCKPWQY